MRRLAAGPRRWGSSSLAILAVLLLGALLPYFLPLAPLITIGLYGMIALGLSLLMGLGGQVSLSQAAFYGIGAYSSAILTTRYELSPWLALLAGLILSGGVAYVVGIPTLRLSWQYLALATLGFGVIVFIAMSELVGLTGGPSGLGGIPRLAIGNLVVDTNIEMYYLVLISLGFVLWISRNIAASRVGRALLALHGSEVAAGAMGVHASRLKLQMFILSALFAALAGSLYAHWILFISPSVFEVIASIDFVVMAVIGGLGTVWGGLLGAAAFVLLTELLRRYVPAFGGAAEVELLFFGVILMLIVLFLPGGMGGAGARLRSILWGRSRRGVETAAPQAQRAQR